MIESITVGNGCLEVAVVELLYQSNHKGRQDRSEDLHSPLRCPKPDYKCQVGYRLLPEINIGHLETKYIGFILKSNI